MNQTEWVDENEKDVNHMLCPSQSAYLSPVEGTSFGHWCPSSKDLSCRM